MKLTRSGVLAVAIAAAFFAGSVVTLAVAGGDAQTAKKKKKKVKQGPAGPAGLQGPQGTPGRDATGASSIDYVSNSATPQQIFVGNGLTLTATCTGGDINIASAGTGSLYVEWTSFTSSADGNNFGIGDQSYTKASASVADILLSDDLNADGQMVYDSNLRNAPGGTITTILFHEEENGGLCVFSGTATTRG
jgi:hypothetical protein